MSLNSEQGSAPNEEDSKSCAAQIENWRQGADRCRDLIDSLFDTLLMCNPGFSRDKRFSPDAIFSHARELDLAWFRFAHRCSDKRVGGSVIHELKNLRKNEDSLFGIDQSQLNFLQSAPTIMIVWEPAKALGQRFRPIFHVDIERVSNEAEYRQRQVA